LFVFFFSALTLWLKKKGEQESSLSENFKKQIEKTNNDLLEAQSQFMKQIKTNQQKLTIPFEKNEIFESYLDVLVSLLSEFVKFSLSLNSKSKRENSIIFKFLELITTISGELVNISLSFIFIYL